MRFLIITLICMCFYGCKREKLYKIPKNNFDSPISTQDWTVVSSVSNPDSFDLLVVYQEKYGGQCSVLCKVLFSNDKTKQYKMISPGGTLILEMANTVSLNYTKKLIQ